MLCLRAIIGFNRAKSFIKHLILSFNFYIKLYRKYCGLRKWVSGDLLSLIINSLDARKQRVVLNGQYSSLASVKAGVPQWSIHCPLFFLIFINDLSDNLISNPKLLADDTSLFSVVQDITLSAKNLNDDLEKINKWAFQWKMSFNPDPNKQVQDFFFQET